MTHTAILLLLLAGGLLTASTFKICAFNIRSFGRAKASNRKVMGTLVQILSRCDISAVQEVRDARGSAIRILLRELNRKDIVSVIDWCQLGDSEAFVRAPFAARFHSSYTAILEFVLLLHHASPREAAHELDLLFGVCMELMEKWKTENVMVLGDLNAASAYVPASAWARIRLRNNPAFHWLISDAVDTTVSHRTCCAYDRIIVHGEELLAAVVPGSAKPFNFTEVLRLTEEEALEVSDHYPVEVNLQLSPKAQREL
ncbi:deoxyribonuclease-1-like [Pogona vitticeps]